MFEKISAVWYTSWKETQYGDSCMRFDITNIKFELVAVGVEII